jgi:uncharacterized C2H2 Zn-finger protein
MPYAAIPGTTLSFVQYYSTINFSCNQTLQQWGAAERIIAAKAKTLSCLQGNSRNDVTSFLYACMNHAVGCSYRQGCRVQILKHERTCRAASPAIFKEFRCTGEDCSRSFDTVGQRTRHVRDAHNWPKTCVKRECKDIILRSPDAVVRHREVHSRFESLTCPEPACKSKTIFRCAKNYRAHSRRVHGIASGRRSANGLVLGFPAKD